MLEELSALHASHHGLGALPSSQFSTTLSPNAIRDCLNRRAWFVRIAGILKSADF
jgi:hypothetical protein